MKFDEFLDDSASWMEDFESGKDGVEGTHEGHSFKIPTVDILKGADRLFNPTEENKLKAEAGEKVNTEDGGKVTEWFQKNYSPYYKAAQYKDVAAEREEGLFDGSSSASQVAGVGNLVKDVEQGGKLLKTVGEHGEKISKGFGDFFAKHAGDDSSMVKIAEKSEGFFKNKVLGTGEKITDKLTTEAGKSIGATASSTLSAGKSIAELSDFGSGGFDDIAAEADTKEGASKILTAASGTLTAASSIASAAGGTGALATAGTLGSAATAGGAAAATGAGVGGTLAAAGAALGPVGWTALALAGVGAAIGFLD